MRRILFHFLVVVVLISTTGCATFPYRYGQNVECEKTYRLQPDEPQIERGRPHGFLDAAGWIWPESLLAKLILWNWKVDNHHVSKRTEEILRQYLAKNELHNVKVRINQCRPGAEWKRLFRNKAIGAGWRYTLGVLSVAMYTAFPGRFFGGDNYNPYTNTINIYSDHSAIALHEGGHAKDFARRTYKGTYAAVYTLPFVSLYHEAKASNDALGYLRAEGSLQDQKDAYKILYPAYATYIAGNAGDFLTEPDNYLVYFGAVIPAHIIGRIKAALIREDGETVPSSMDDAQ